MLQPGDDAPDFSLPNQDGDTVSLSSLRGKRILLFAYPRAATPGCTTQACGLRDHFADLTGDDTTVILGLSPDEPAKLAKWRAKEQLPYDLLSDPEHQVLEAYGAWGERSMYGKKYMGVIRSHFVIGEDGKLLDVQIKISPKQSIETAVKFLSA